MIIFLLILSLIAPLAQNVRRRPIVVAAGGNSATFVQSASQYNGSFVLAYGSNNTAGNLLVMVASGESGGGALAGTVTDTRSNTWTCLTGIVDTSHLGTIIVCYSPNCAAGANTVTFSGSSPDNSMAVYEYSGVATSSPLEAVSQSISCNGNPVPTGGTFTLTYSGQTTAGIAWNASAATIQTALEALSNIAPGDISVAGGPMPTTAVVVTFVITPTLMTINGASLTGGTSVQVGVDPAVYTDVASISNTTTPTSLAITTAHANDLLLLAWADEQTGQASVGPSTGYAQREQHLSHLDAQMDNVNVTTGSHTPGVVLASTSQTWLIAVLAFKNQ